MTDTVTDMRHIETIRRMFPRIIVIVVCMLCFRMQGQIIADHTVIDAFEDIPAEYIDSVKSMLLILPGESHGRAYHYGLDLLESEDSRYAVNVIWGSDRQAPESHTGSYLRASRNYRHGNSWEYWGCGEEEFFTSQSAIEDMKTGLTYTANNYSGRIVFGFGWCWDLTWHNNVGGAADPVYGCRWAGSTVGGPSGDLRWGIDYEDSVETGNAVCLQTYIGAVEEYNNTVSSITTIYTTGPVDGYSGESGYQRYLKHEALRSYVRTNGGVLLDYADILCWDNGAQYTTTWNGHTYQIGDPDLATGGTGYDGGDGGSHISQQGCVLLAKGLWWMLARIAGWDGNAEPATQVAPPVITPDGGEYVEQVEVTLDVSTVDADLYYSVIGEDPDQNSEHYQQPFFLTTSATLKVRGFKDGLTASSITSADFTIIQDETGPAIVSAIAVNDTEIHLEFSEKIDSSSAATVANYSVSNISGVNSVEVGSAHTTVMLVLDEAMMDGVRYTVTMQNISDLYGNQCDPAESASFLFENIDFAGLWNFETGTGNVAADASGNNNDGIISGATWNETGIRGGCLSFDGNDTVDVGVSPFGIDTSGQFSITLWFYFTGSLSGRLIERGEYIHPFRIDASADDRLNTGIRTSDGTDYLATSQAVAANIWHHCVVTFNEGQRTIYLNGTQVESNTLSGDLTVTASMHTFIGNGFIGYIDEVGIITRAVSANEVETLYQEYTSSTKQYGLQSGPSYTDPVTARTMSSLSGLAIDFERSIANARLTVYTFSGREIYSETRSNVKTFKWSGYDRYGKKTGNGVFFVEIVADGRKIHQQTVKLGK